MTDPCVLRSSEFYEKGNTEFTANGNYIGELLTGSKKLNKESEILLNLDKLCIFFGVKSTYTLVF